MFDTFCLWFSDVATEKTQKSLFDGIEKFDASRLKHTETQEKNQLPDKDGMFLYNFPLSATARRLLRMHILMCNNITKYSLFLIKHYDKK